MIQYFIYLLNIYLDQTPKMHLNTFKILNIIYMPDLLLQSDDYNIFKFYTIVNYRFQGAQVIRVNNYCSHCVHKINKTSNF